MKKVFLTFSTFFALTLLFSFSKVLATNGDLNTAGQAVKNVTQGAANVVENVVKDAGTAVEQGSSTIKNATGNMVNTAEARTTNNGYTATRTSTAQDTFMGMNATAWTWLVIGVLGVLVIGLIWYYGKDHTPITQDLDEK